MLQLEATAVVVGVPKRPAAEKNEHGDAGELGDDRLDAHQRPNDEALQG